MAGSIRVFMPGNGLIVGNTIEHMPVGLLERYCPLAKFEYSAMTPVELIKIPYAAFDRIFIHNNPQRAFRTGDDHGVHDYLHARSAQRTSAADQLSDDSADAVSVSLHRQQTHKGENEGNNIIKRTNLSRTHVFRVLADLKAGGYITMVRGKLISINRPLP